MTAEVEVETVAEIAKIALTAKSPVTSPETAEPREDQEADQMSKIFELVKFKQ